VLVGLSGKKVERVFAAELDCAALEYQFNSMLHWLHGEREDVTSNKFKYDFDWFVEVWQEMLFRKHETVH
jgi:hypothetical protein